MFGWWIHSRSHLAPNGLYQQMIVTHCLQKTRTLDFDVAINLTFRTRTPWKNHLEALENRMQKLQGNLFKGDTATCFKWPVEKRQFKKTQFRGVGKLWMCWMHAKLSPFVLKSAQELQKLNGAAPGHAQSNYFLPSSRRTLQIHHGIPFLPGS